MTQSPGVAAGRTMPAPPLYLAFAGTGIGVALPGALLPALLVRWHLGDEQAGRLFLCAWIGSSAGALLARGSLRTILLAGCLATSVAAIGIGLTQGGAADIALALFGLGLGMVMTSISLIRQQQSTEAGGRSGPEMVRLNLLWAAGACTCPTLALRALAMGAIRPLLFVFALAFALMAAWTALQPDLRLAPVAAQARSRGLFRTTPPGLIVMTFLITGIEASGGGWLATYARRGEHSLAATVAAPSLFWAGLLLSRGLWSAFPHWLTHDRVVRWSAALMAFSAVLLVVAQGEVAFLAAASLLGFGIGPVYPLLLSWALRFQRGGAIFFLAGVGSACLPWLTGLVSGRQHSLRVGFWVPMLGTLLLFVLALAMPLVRWSRMDSAAQG
jgi:fucose permease